MTGVLRVVWSKAKKKELRSYCRDNSADALKFVSEVDDVRRSRLDEIEAAHASVGGMHRVVDRQPSRSIMPT